MAQATPHGARLPGELSRGGMSRVYILRRWLTGEDGEGRFDMQWGPLNDRAARQMAEDLSGKPLEEWRDLGNGNTRRCNIEGGYLTLEWAWHI